jgi:sodium/hydrogen antiporter
LNHGTKANAALSLKKAYMTDVRIEATWFLVIGSLLIGVGLARGFIARLPLTGAMIYLAAGFILGPAGAGLLNLDLHRDAHVLRLATETGLMISLFAIGLFLRIPLGDRLWLLPMRLAGPAMVLTVAIIAAFGRYGLGLGATIILAAALAPTDPVLANELRLRAAGDGEPLRFALSAEGGCNDGAAYPFALLGLSLLNAGPYARIGGLAFAGAVVWGIASSVVIGALLGSAVVSVVTRLRTRYGEALGLEGFFALGLMSVCYGAALFVHGYAFIAVFVAGVALRRKELQATGEKAPNEALGDVERADPTQVSTNPELAHAYMAESMMSFAVEIERIVELALMLLIGSVVSAYWREFLSWEVILPVLAVFFIARPVSAAISLLHSSLSRQQTLLIGWLGIRGVGAFYYLLFAIEQGPRDAINPVIPLILATIVGSVFLHGISATVLMNRYVE